MRRRLLHQIIFALAIVGLLVAAYQTVEHYGAVGTVCDITESFSCSVVTESQYGELPAHSGIALAFWGALWWIGMLLFLRWIRLKGADRDDERLEFGLWAYAASGVLFALYLVFVEVYLLPLQTGAVVICPFCTVQHALILAIFVLAWIDLERPVGEHVRQTLYRADGERLDPRPFFFAAVMLVLLVGGYFILSPPPAAQQDEFAACLAERGATMYGFDACPHCNRQKALFGEGVFEEHFTRQGLYVKCRPAAEANSPLGEKADVISSLVPVSSETTQGAACEANVGSGTPTWVIDGEQLVGEKELSVLADVSGCELPGGGE